MANCIKLRTKNAHGKVPKGYEVQVVARYSVPGMDELKQALVNAGFPETDARAYMSMSSWEEV